MAVCAFRPLCAAQSWSDVENRNAALFSVPGSLVAADAGAPRVTPGSIDDELGTARCARAPANRRGPSVSPMVGRQAAAVVTLAPAVWSGQPVPANRRGPSVSPMVGRQAAAVVTLAPAVWSGQPVPCERWAAASGAASGLVGYGQPAASAQSSRLLRGAFCRRRSPGSRRPGARRYARSSACSAASRDGPSDQSEGDGEGLPSPCRSLSRSNSPGGTSGRLAPRKRTEPSGRALATVFARGPGT